MSRTRLYTLLGVVPDVDELTLRRALVLATKEIAELASAGAPSATRRVKALREAYDVLRDPDLRALYDEFGEASLKKGFSARAAREAIAREERAKERRTKALLVQPDALQRPPSGPGTPAVWEIHVRVGRGLAKRGGLHRFKVNRPVTCPSCDGSGRREHRCPRCGGTRSIEVRTIASCAPCHGVGQLPDRVPCRTCRGAGTRGRSGRDCARCGGAGQRVKLTDCLACRARGLLVHRAPAACPACAETGHAPCRRCNGDRTIRKPTPLRLRVPRGLDAGSVYRYPGAGFSPSDAEPGDLFVRFEVPPPPVKRRRRRRW